MKIKILLLCACISTQSMAGKIVPKVPSASILIADSDGNILIDQKSDMVRPIASISKLMIALLVAEQDMDEMIGVPTVRSVQSKIPKNQRTMSRRDLLILALMKSDNFATQILCTHIDNCVSEMNIKASELGMINTRFVEPTGLSKDNVSTATDLLKLMIVTSANQSITAIAKLPTTNITLGHKSVAISNTNPLTQSIDTVLSKTGFTDPAGGCLVMTVNSRVGRRFLILLGSRNAKTRIPEMAKLYAGLR